MTITLAIDTSTSRTSVARAIGARWDGFAL